MKPVLYEKLKNFHRINSLQELKVVPEVKVFEKEIVEEKKKDTLSMNAIMEQEKLKKIEKLNYLLKKIEDKTQKLSASN